MITGRGTESLRPRARIINVIGNELISDYNVAMLELVKNSFDADSRSVTIRFDGPMVEGQGKITVTDFGNGMSLDSVKHGWMEPATGDKAMQRMSPNGRRMLGEKGVGRFASAKLAKKLTLITKTLRGKEIIAHFDWSSFDNPKKYLDEVTCEWKTREPQVINEKGTVLILEGLKESWDLRKLKSLKLSLSRLIDPMSPNLDFTIKLEIYNTSNELTSLAGEITPPPSLGKPHYSIKGRMDSLGNSSYIFYRRRDDNISQVEEKYDDKSLLGVSCGPFNFEFRAWDRDDLDSLAKENGITLRDIKKDLNDASGISVYRDGFRVLPYGESSRKNDWLGLDLRRVQNPTMRLSNNQVVGQVSINLDANPTLRDQSNREGIIHTVELDDLGNKVLWLLSKLESERYRERKGKRETTNGTSIFSNINFKPVIDLIETKLAGDSEAKTLVMLTQNKITDGIRKAKEVISRYHRLSTLGMLVDVVLHDGNDVLLKIDTQIQFIVKELGTPHPDYSKINKRIELILNGKNRLAEQFKRLEPFGGRTRGPKKTIVLEDAVNDVFLLFQDELFRNRISFTISNGRTEYKIDRSGFETIIVNLLQNSIYWISSLKDGERKIVVEINDDREAVWVTFSDSGPGVAHDDQTLIFDPYFTTKPNGIGLGLTIAGEQAAEYGGSLELLSDGPLDGATFRFSLSQVEK